MCHNRTSNRPHRKPLICWFSPLPRRILWLALIAIVGAPGCGTSAGDALFNTATAAGTSLLDQILTAAVNGTLGLLNPPPASSADETPGDGGGSGGGGNFDGLTGDAANGQTLFTANNCASCHCADASGGCALSAPSLVGVVVTIVDDHLRGGASHAGGKFQQLTDQEIVDLTAFLASP